MEPGGEAGHAVAKVARALSPRGALAVRRVDGALVFALRAALAMALVALPIVLAGRPDLAVYAMLGSFTTTFGRNLPYPRRARVLAWVALAMTAYVGCGVTLAALVRPQAGGTGVVLVVAATAVVAGAAKFACDAARLGGLGAVLLLFSFAVAAESPAALTDVLPRTGLAAAAAAVAWGLAVAGRYVHPDRPQRLAVAVALRALARLLTATATATETEGTDPRGAAGRERHRATVAVLHAYHCLGLAPPAHRSPGLGPPGAGARTGPEGTDVCVRLADVSWALLIGCASRPPPKGAESAELLRRQARLLADRRRARPGLLPGLPAPYATAGAVPPAPPARTADADPPLRSAPVPAPLAADSTRRAGELFAGPRLAGPVHRSVRVVPALRMVLGTGVAGALALGLGLGHGYWAAISAAAVLHSVNIRTTAQRAVQRTLGTVLGLLLALGVLGARPDPVVLVLVIVVLEFLLECVVVLNYGLGVVFLTPLALLLSELAAPAPVGTLVQDRALASLLGIAVGLACAVLVVDDHAAVRVEHALAACARATRQAEEVLAGAAGPPPAELPVRLAEAVVELREADDAAAGELWQAGIDPALLAAAERRGYLLLERLLPHPPRPPR
ncbi:FUSC family protein [Streptomyces sp. NPDC018057]|uniref:FUSC family protein n=1 Tax=unclassified Streptomyces TaxID=2593676 RepID=UPI0037AEA4F9